MDEVDFVNAAQGAADNTMIHMRLGSVPLFIMPYLGALKAWIYAPVFRLFGVSALTIRLPAILLAAVTLLIFYQLMRPRVGILWATMALWIMAVDPANLFPSRLDWGPTVLMHLFQAAILAIWLSYRDRPEPWMSVRIKRFWFVLRTWNFLRLVPVLCIGLLLINTFLLYKKGAYFWLDDFNNLYWVQRATFIHMIRYVLNPSFDGFRPVGMLSYWLLLRCFDLNPAPYHWLAWSLHTANTALVYFILKRLTKARSGAAVGAMLFASQAAFSKIYWDFGTIFELLAAFFSFAALLLWASERRDWPQVVFASLLLFLAMKSKEMAVAMPVAWFCYDLIVRGKRDRKVFAHWIPPGALALLCGLVKALTMKGSTPTEAYYVSINGPTLVTGFATYFNMLFRTNFSAQFWCTALLLCLVLLILLRNRLALFFLLYVFISFLPVIFLINHRFAFYWYLPFLGICGLAAMLADSIAFQISARNPRWLGEGAAYCIFALLCWSTFLLHQQVNLPERAWVNQRAHEYRAFIRGLKSLSPPQHGEIIYFNSQPSNFYPVCLLAATQVALRRTDVGARFVSQFPADATYRLQFKGSRLIRLPQ